MVSQTHSLKKHKSHGYSFNRSTQADKYLRRKVNASEAEALRGYRPKRFQNSDQAGGAEWGGIGDQAGVDDSENVSLFHFFS